jgi:hypothetical protein
MRQLKTTRINQNDIDQSRKYLAAIYRVILPLRAFYKSPIDAATRKTVAGRIFSGNSGRRWLP